METFSIDSTVLHYPDGQYQAIKEAILGKRYHLSLTFMGETRARTLNQAYRKKDYVPNVLSFPLTDTVGEIVITPAIAKREAVQFHLSYAGYVQYLFIHGCLHLKGYDHGATMERLEARYKKRFSLV